jgi:hypothetical protein
MFSSDLKSIFKSRAQNNSVPAENFIQKNLGNKNILSKIDKNDLLKRLNAIVFNHCKNEVPHTGKEEITELYETCKTACGGYSYVLKGLLEAFGFKVRYLNFYNLPNQGNHTAIEVEFPDGRWVFLDPTFGTFFTKEGKIDGALMSIDEVRYQPNRKALLSKVFVAVKDAKDEQKINYSKYIDSNLKKIYEKNKFNFKYMKLSNYLLAEQVEHVGSSSLVPLVANIKLNKGEYRLGQMDFENISSGVNSFLKDTNELLKDSDLSNDVSFLFSKVGNYSPYFRSLNIINIENMKKNKEYQLKLSGFAYNESSLLIKTIGRNIVLKKNEVNKISPGKFSKTKIFKAQSGKGQILITVAPPERMVDLLYLEVSIVP